MQNKQTAVGWLMSNLTSLFVDDSGHYKELFEQAKAMEKEQIVDARVKIILDSNYVEAEQYYQETYNNSKLSPPRAHCEEA